MKKLMFLVHFSNLKKSSGIIEKIINQSKSMFEEGILFKTYIFFKAEEIESVKLFKSYDFIEFIPLNFYQNTKNKFKKVFMLNKVYKAYENICQKENNNYDFIYMRYNIMHPAFIRFVKKLKNRIIFEHNSIELEEYKGNKDIYNIIMTKLFDKKIKNMAVAYVCISQEIFNFQAKIYSNQKGIIIPNGIDVKRFKIKKYNEFDGKNLNLIFVGNIRYWHGLERILYSIEQYNGTVNITFNIFGEINQDDYLTPIINELKTKHKIKILGYKSSQKLDKYFNKAHVAIGTLGTYKKNMTLASTLKNREYFSRGIPIVFSEIDEDISILENKGLFLTFPNNETPIDMEKIIDFTTTFYKNGEENIKKIRKFAENNLDYGIKIKKLKGLLDELKN